MEILRHFEEHEIACNCCGEMPSSKEAVFFARDVDCLRDSLSFGFIVNSWYRCEKHNKAVGGSVTSSHLSGLAVDIKAPDGEKKSAIVGRALLLGFRVVVYDGFIHLDKDKNKPQGLFRAK